LNSLAHQLASLAHGTGGGGGSSALAQLALALSLVAPGFAWADPGDELYRDGLYERAIVWWVGAARQGDPHAAYRLGTVYADGAVVERDAEAAARWYLLGAERGDPRAQLDLATLYDTGEGVEQSYEQAARWYRESALQGEMASQYNLGVMYAMGQGVDRDPVEAYKWFILARRQGFPVERLEDLRRLEKTLSEAELGRALEAADRFEPRGRSSGVEREKRYPPNAATLPPLGGRPTERRAPIPGDEPAPDQLPRAGGD
jgi:TPR repeat protein